MDSAKLGSERAGSDSVQSVERAFRMLQIVAAAPSSLTEVAREMQLPLSTVRRLLTTLEGLGAVVRDDDARWSSGPAVHALGTADPAAALVARAHPHLEDLVAATGETAGVSIRDDHAVVYLDQVAANHEVQIRDWTGERLALHVASSGQVLLAFAPPDVVSDYLARPLAGSASATITSPGALRKRLADVRRDGFAVTDREFSDDIASIAAPVFGRDEVIAALHVHGPAYRFPAGRARRRLIEIVVGAAATMSGQPSRRIPSPSTRSNP